MFELFCDLYLDFEWWLGTELNRRATEVHLVDRKLSFISSSDRKIEALKTAVSYCVNK